MLSRIVRLGMLATMCALITTIATGIAACLFGNPQTAYTQWVQHGKNYYQLRAADSRGMSLRWIAGSCTNCGKDTRHISPRYTARFYHQLGMLRPQGKNKKAQEIVSLVVVGYPFPCFVYEELQSHATVGAIAIRPRPLQLRWERNVVPFSIRGIPWMPIPTWLVLNILVWSIAYAAMIAPLVHVASRIAITRRLRLGKCPRCCYPLVVADGGSLCPECGKEDNYSGTCGDADRRPRVDEKWTLTQKQGVASAA